MVSFTGSTRAGVLVSEAAAPTVKRVALELGGKSPNIILPDADLAAAVKGGVRGMMTNTGQSCNAPSRMLVHKDQHDEAADIAKQVAEAIQVGTGEKGSLGPISNANQYNKVQDLIQKGIDEGATLVAGGPGRPEGLNRGYYVKPTIFANVSNDMTIAQEEIFGPVLCMIPYESEEQAIEIANDTVYGLSGYVSAGSVEKATEVGKQIRTGMVHLNGAGPDLMAPFGGYKQSGNGREWGPLAFDEFLEIKAMMGAGA